MASPQLENGYVRIANELVEALARTHLSSHESQILWALWRKTYGWHKKSDRISLAQFATATGLRKDVCSRTLTRLIERKIIDKNVNGKVAT
ncbi:MAG TPA: replication protein, partial [Thiotrichaceae bacterium]|nr:replication protein [Thiotrichaceae bacterium]